MAQILSGSGSATELDWMPPTLALPSILQEPSTENLPAPSDDCTHPHYNLLPPNADDLVAEDDLEDNEDVLCADDAVLSASAFVSWELPALHPDPTVNYNTNSDLDNPAALHNTRPRVLHLVPPRHKLSFDPVDITRFISPTALLSDECLNGGALLLQAQLIRSAPDNNSQGFDPQSVAILSTHNLVRIRYGATDAAVWRAVKRVEYWSKKVWILLIHRISTEHWVVCIIYPEQKRLHLFDSFADHRSWHGDVKVRLFNAQLHNLLTICSGYYETCGPFINSRMQKWVSLRPG